MKRRLYLLTLTFSLIFLLACANRGGGFGQPRTVAKPAVEQPPAALPVAPAAVAQVPANLYLPLMQRYFTSRYVGAFVPMVDLTTWNGKVTAFETLANKEHGVHLVSSGFGCSWADEVGDFRPQLDFVRSLVAMPLISWMPMDCSNGGVGNVNALGLPDILNGSRDAYITQWATEIGALGYPVFVRWGHEMNIPSYSWAGQHAFGSNGRTSYQNVTEDCGLTACYGDLDLHDGPERYVDAYRHVFNLADPLAPNIVWLWNPNARNWPLPAVAPWNQFNNYYPGDAYVDWVGLDGYNWGDRSGNGYGKWVSFDEMFGAELNDLAQRYPDKPQIIAEFAAVEDEVDPQRKPDFIRDAYESALSYPRLMVLIWVHDNEFFDSMHEVPQKVDFRINSSSASLQAYQEATVDWNAYPPVP